MMKISQVIHKLLIIFLVILITSMPTKSYASDFWGEVFQSGKDFLQGGQAAGQDLLDGNSVKTEFDKLYNVLLGIGVVLAVIVGAVLGVRFIFGSISEQVKIKEMLIPYVIACIVIFGAFGIWKLLITIGNNIISNNSGFVYQEGIDEWQGAREVIDFIDGECNWSTKSDEQVLVYYTKVYNMRFKSGSDKYLDELESQMKARGLGARIKPR